MKKDHINLNILRGVKGHIVNFYFTSIFLLMKNQYL